MFRTQPAVSLQVRKLERELGRQLIDRSRKRVVPTEAGRLLYDRGRLLLDELGSLKRLVGDAEREPHGRLAIASNLALITNVLPRALGAYHRRYPGVQIALSNLRSEGILRALIDGEAEIGLGYLAARHRQIDRETVSESAFVLVDRRAAASPRPFSLRDMRSRPLIHFEKGIELRRYLERHLPHPPQAVVLELPSMAAILEYVRSGFGCSVLPEFALPASSRGSFSVTPLGRIVPPLPVEAYTVRGRPLSPAAQQCLELLRRRLALRA